MVANFDFLRVRRPVGTKDDKEKVEENEFTHRPFKRYHELLPLTSPLALADSVVMNSMKKADARRIWMRAQKLDEVEPFGAGAAATRAAVEHLGYVQIDTINVIERCHHHILHTRIPQYQRQDLHRAQTFDKSVFEYWTHALSYVPTRDLRYFMSAMRERGQGPSRWYQSVTPSETRKVMRMIRQEGPISIRDIEDDVLVEKDHEWASRKPSKKALQKEFYAGRLVISERVGMLKKYELIERHFDWANQKPKPATPREVTTYLLDRALRSQGLVSLDSICHLEPSRKPDVLRQIEQRVKWRELIEVKIEDAPKHRHWIQPETLETVASVNLDPLRTLILSPFDPLVIQRKRLALFFGYEHRFEAYVPKEKRVLGYFALPVLAGDRVVAALDLKTDRAARELKIQKWTWMKGARSKELKRHIESELDRFEDFQLAP